MFNISIFLRNLDCKTVRIFAYSIKYARAVKQKVWNEAENIFFSRLTRP